jgi:hypothetical protein
MAGVDFEEPAKVGAAVKAVVVEASALPDPA